MSDSWMSQRSVARLGALVTVSSEQVNIDYSVGSTAYHVDYAVRGVEERSGNCPDKTEVYQLQRMRLTRGDGGEVAPQEQAFWTVGAELRAADSGEAGSDVLHVNGSDYNLSAGDYCPLLGSAPDTSQDAGPDDAGAANLCAG